MTIENIDSSNPLPLYFQVYQSLLERMQRGEFPPGSFLPPERQLTEDYGVSRIIVFPHHGYHNASLYRELQQQHFPLVMVDRYYPQIDTDCVIFDDEIASYELAKQLLQRGRRRIAVISYFEVEATSVNHRLSGYRRALQQWGLPYHDDLIWLDIYPSFHRSDELHYDTYARARLRKYVARYKPDALLTLNDDVLERVIYDLLILRDTSLSVTASEQKPRSSMNW